MSTNESMICITEEAGGDLSALQFHFVAMASDGQVDGAGDGAQAVGVLMNAPAAAGRACEIAVAGVAKVVCGATVAAGARVASAADSEAITAATGDVILGIALEGGSAGELIRVLLHAAGDIAA